MPSSSLGPKFFERVWHWVSNHPDVRIIHQNEIRVYSLEEFEAAEAQDSSTPGVTSSVKATQPVLTQGSEAAQPSTALTALSGALRDRLSVEKAGSKVRAAISSQAPVLKSPRQSPRNVPQSIINATPIFDDPEPTITAPRLYASQSRIWQALTGHGIDLKRVPSMEFVLLSLIAARGATGIPQPELTQLSGQDKRSVPHRTNELARKGYIVKHPVQHAKIRTSLCVHTRFISQTTFLSSGVVEDVYKEDSFVLAGFVHLLYSKLKDAGIVPTRNIRTMLVMFCLLLIE